MTFVGRRIRRALVAPLAVLLLAPSVAIPILDRADFQHQLAIEESGHDPAHCPPGHDHDLCMQVRANHPVPTPGTEYVQRLGMLWSSSPQAPGIPALLSPRGSHHPRAPPLI